ncbi:MAG: zinc-binding dehydrogenase, partial [Promicromonosporaceae bacterium]|nr:zinc-binding dehydrogenase [Promicromonosporaceae bacterium]
AAPRGGGAPEPPPGPGEVRVRVRAVGLNPMDWQLAGSPDVAARFGVTLPAGFGTDLAGVVDEVGADVERFAVGDRVHGGALGRAAGDHVVLPVAPSPVAWLGPVPDGVSDTVAAALPTPGLTALAALAAIGVRPADIVLVGGAAGGVGVLAVQLARLAGGRVIGTCSPGTFEFLRGLGATPVAYGPGLADRVREVGPITAATDLFGTEAAGAALALGVPPARISTIAAGPTPPGGVRATGGFDTAPADLQRITSAIADGRLTVPVAATFPLERIQDAVALQASGHVHGKVVVTL